MKASKEGAKVLERLGYSLIAMFCNQSDILKHSSTSHARAKRKTSMMADRRQHHSFFALEDGQC